MLVKVIAGKVLLLDEQGMHKQANDMDSVDEIIMIGKGPLRMVMGEKDEVDVRQVVQVHRRIRPPDSTAGFVRRVPVTPGPRCT